MIGNTLKKDCSKWLENKTKYSSHFLGRKNPFPREKETDSNYNLSYEGNSSPKDLLRSSKLTTFVTEELFEVMQKNASERWIFVTKSLPAYFLCSAYLLKLKKLKRTTLFFLKTT